MCQRMRLIAVGAALALVLGAARVGAAGAGRCGPFGDAPAEVNRGWFASFIAAHNPICFGGQVLGPWQDARGSERWACLYQPPDAGPQSPLPLVIFLHGSLATADTVRLTGLTGMIGSADLGGARRGFILLAPEGRYTVHYYPGPDADAVGWDNWYRQLDPAGAVTVGGVRYEENADAAAIDHFVADEVASGAVDRNRIYVMGWSNGAAMGILYALNRPQVAAAAMYSAPDPFGAFDDPCTQIPVVTAPSGNLQIQVRNGSVPLMHVRNACDIGGICPNGDLLAGQLRAFDPNVVDVIIDEEGARVSRCEDECGVNPMADGRVGVWGAARGLKNHVFWPREWNGRMLKFLRAHPLGGAR